ncbi:MAG: proteasome accessory factor PafA2 family protein [Candidatus Hydrogenedentes bacterium]|nr:proteasome accessory factor PafA2 family protein [Candidatus Hydrogenedentota bacterium]
MREKKVPGDRAARQVQRVVKLAGGDIELGNFIQGLHRPQGSGPEAAHALLREIKGLPRTAGRNACQCPACRAARQSRTGEPATVSSSGYRTGYNYSGYGYGDYGDYGGDPGGGYYSSASVPAFDPQDWGRRFLLENGGCCYIDLGHLEICLPEVRSAHDWVAAWHAMLRIARHAMHAANAKLPEGQRIVVLANNSDGRGNSFGSHTNVLLTEDAWEGIFHRKLYPMLYLAAYQVSSIVFTGQGKAGSENGAPPVPYQLSQRMDFMETLTGIATTVQRPLVNSRDEALCGSWTYRSEGPQAPRYRRLHCIFYDSNLAHVACLLKIGVLQIVLSLLEAGKAKGRLMLDDPVEAGLVYSHDPSLRARARLADGRLVSALELQRLFLEEAEPFVVSGECEETVARSREIFELWQDTLERLERRDWDVLSGRLDWVLKREILQAALDRNRELDWDSPELRYLDQVYASLDEDEGLYFAYEQDGSFLDRVVSEEAIARFTTEPPEDTRAWTRAMLLRTLDADDIDSCDWDRMVAWGRVGKSGISRQTIHLPNPLQFTRAQMEPLFATGDAQTILEALAAPPQTAARTYPSASTYQTDREDEEPSWPIVVIPTEPAAAAREPTPRVSSRNTDEGEQSQDDAVH